MGPAVSFTSWVAVASFLLSLEKVGGETFSRLKIYDATLICTLRFYCCWKSVDVINDLVCDRVFLGIATETLIEFSSYTIIVMITIKF